MEKTEVASRLKKAGYQVQFDSSIVTVILPMKVNTNQEIKKLKAFFAEIGYDSSFGIKQNREKGAEFKEEVLEETTVSEDVISEEVESIDKNSGSDITSFYEEPKIVEIGEQFSLEDFGIN